MCSSRSEGGKKEELTSNGVSVIFTTRPNKIYFGLNLRAGKIHQFRMCIALSKWSGHVAGSLSHGVVCHPSSPTSGAHNLAKTYNKSLLVPSMRPLTHREYAATVYSLVPQHLQFSATSWFLKCLLPSAMNVSGGVKLWKISSREQFVVVAVPCVLNFIRKNPTC